jgi:lipoprotein-releasing system permease protein
MQDLYGLNESVHGLKVRLKAGVDVYSVIPDLADLLGSSYSVLSWLDSNRDFLFVIQMEKNILFFLLLFIILVSAFAITSSLLITVVRKMREIGLFGALGGRSWQVGMCFCVQGFLIGLVGTGLGFGLAFLALHYRNNIVHAFARWTQSEAALLRFYQFSDLPVYYSIQDLVTIGVASIVISTFAGFIPAWRAAKMRPAEALRSE